LGKSLSVPRALHAFIRKSVLGAIRSLARSFDSWPDDFMGLQVWWGDRGIAH